MRLGIMQPYFFPYLGYFDVINSVDRWIAFDTAQYIRHGWVNRNRVLHPTSGWQYLSVPLARHHRETPIKDVRAAGGAEWRRRALAQLEHYRMRARFFDETMALVQECLAGEETLLARINVSILAAVCRHLGIGFDYAYLSEMRLALGPIEGPGDWALQIATALGATEYVNPPGGGVLFDPARFRAVGIKLTIKEPVAFCYTCRGYDFVPDLSVIDVLMWNRPAAVRAYLDGRR